MVSTWKYLAALQREILPNDLRPTQIHVYFESLDYQMIAEQPAYLLSDLLADLGGILGLFNLSQKLFCNVRSGSF